MAQFNAVTGSQAGLVGGRHKRGAGFKQQAQEWIKANGFEKAISWINGESDRKATFAMGLLFSYALGRPAEHIQIEDRTTILVNLAKDPFLNAIAKRFGIDPALRELDNGLVVDGELAVPPQEPPTPSV